ncbi:hypothetical protein, partial [Caballeronia sp. 15711]|uniref:hypothetical protein n=1 Tax=Caballeronia sp. 15711 TaxID=3391029 RepID=UPI0039E5C7D0
PSLLRLWLYANPRGSTLPVGPALTSTEVILTLSKATKKRSKENAFNSLKIKCPQRAVFIHWYPKSTVLARATDV